MTGTSPPPMPPPNPPPPMPPPLPKGLPRPRPGEGFMWSAKEPGKFVNHILTQDGIVRAQLAYFDDTGGWSVLFLGPYPPANIMDFPHGMSVSEMRTAIEDVVTRVYISGTLARVDIPKRWQPGKEG